MMFENYKFYIIQDKISTLELDKLKKEILRNGGAVVDAISDATLILSAVQSPFRIERCVPLDSISVPIVKTQWIHACAQQEKMVDMQLYVIDLDKFIRDLKAKVSPTAAIPLITLTQSPGKVQSSPTLLHLNSKTRPDGSTLGSPPTVNRQLTGKRPRSRSKSSNSSSDNDDVSLSPSKKAQSLNHYSDLLDPAFRNSAYECQHPTPLHGPNDDLVAEFMVIRDCRQCDGNETSALSYSKTIASIRAYTRRIESVKEAEQIVNVGSKTAKMIGEFLKYGYIVEAEKLRRDQKYTALMKLMKVYGAGSKVANQWYQLGYRDIHELLDYPKLSQNQRVWIENAKDLLTPIDREEGEQIAGIVKQLIEEVEPGCKVEVTGGYKRGKELSYDLDILICPSENGGGQTSTLLQRIIDKMRQQKLFDHIFHLASGNMANPERIISHNNIMDRLDKAFLLFGNPGKLNDAGLPIARQVDLIVTEPQSWATALLGWTGSRQFERSIRRYAKDVGFHLNSHGLYDLSTGKYIPTRSEEDIFNSIGLQYLDPTLRNC
ncbi:hypothetical protein MIR68_011054 [Amoeboaphelidium protococcarum]|nr:hypothetical protein MIR68_011054 [Amoeboaphelidium protococcarum]